MLFAKKYYECFLRHNERHSHPDAGFMVMLFLSFISIFGCISFFVEGEDEIGFLLLIPLAVHMLYVLVWAIDSVIDFSIKFVTYHKHSRDSFLLRMWLGLESDTYMSSFNLSERHGAFFHSLVHPALLIGAAVVFPSSTMYVLTVLAVPTVYMGLLYIGRFLFSVSEKLNRHINDPKAHSK